MEVWHIWAIVALIFIIVEIFTYGFAVICLGFGCVAASIASACGAGFKFQLLWFAIVTFLAFLLVRPLAVKYFRHGHRGRPSGIAALVGRMVTVSETIPGGNACGRVVIDGDSWQARSASGKDISQGTVVKVVGVDGNILTVEAGE